MTVRFSAIRTFSKIARESFRELTDIKPKADKLRSKFIKIKSDYEIHDVGDELFSLEEKVEKLTLITIVFSAIAIEAYIYDYAARHFTDTFVQNYIDKLDTVSKWVIVPRLVTGSELPRGHKWLELLKSLVKERNSIIHNKSSEMPASPEKARRHINKIRQEREQAFQKAKLSIQLLDLLVTEISNLDTEESFWIESHLGRSN